jgi:poly(3-hydroxybutyrate) depolymerase
VVAGRTVRLSMSDSAYSFAGRAAFTYAAYELAHAAVNPYRAVAGSVDRMLNHPSNPLAQLPGSAAIHAGWRVFDEVTKRYAKPDFGIESVCVDGETVGVTEDVVLRKPFCQLRRFVKDGRAKRGQSEPKVLIVAPLSGHFATLLRGTVREMAVEHDVYITDWMDARSVPLMAGTFDLSDYIDYLLEFCRHLGPDVHVIAVCQPCVPALAATALLAQDGGECQPRSLTLMAGPVDSASNPTAVNKYATEHDLDWFRSNVITYVPFPHAGAMRPVYPGFLQLAGFMGMNADAHIQAYRGYFDKLVDGSSEDAAAHKRFYDEYLAVMDLTSEYFLQTIDEVFLKRSLACGEFVHRGQVVDCSQIRQTSLLTVEGTRDDICGLGQTEAAHALCSSLADHQRSHYVQEGVGHYGVFNGARWREQIQPRIRAMIQATIA